MCTSVPNYTSTVMQQVAQKANRGLFGEAPQETVTFAGSTVPAKQPQIPEGSFSSYRFDDTGQVMGSLNGKDFSAVPNLRVNFDDISKAFADYTPTKKVNGNVTSLASLANQLYGANAEQNVDAYKKGGEITQFRADDKGNLFANISNGDTSGFIPINGFPLQDSGDGNFGTGGRRAFFDPTGLVSLNRSENEEFAGYLGGYSRVAEQALKMADKTTLLTGARSGG